MEPAASSMFNALRKDIKLLKELIEEMDERLKAIEERHEDSINLNKGFIPDISEYSGYTQLAVESWPYLPRKTND